MRKLIFAFAASVLATGATAQVQIDEVVSPSGIKAWFINEPSIPFTALELMFVGGAATDPAGKAGAANLMTALIEEGAGDMDARAFAVAQEELAASFGFRVFDETLTISAKFLSENRDDALALLKTAMTQPRFDQTAIDRVRAQVLSGIASDENDPNDIANRTFDGLAFGDHPYAIPLSGTKETVTGLTRDDMVASHLRLLTRNNLVVSAVGDITADQLGVLLDDLLGDLPDGDMPSVAPVEFAIQGGKTVVDLPVPQSVALFGHAGLNRDDPDFFAAFILNTILGGSGFENRLYDEVREKRGLTYGISTFLIDKEQTNMIMGSVASANDRIAEAIEVTKDVWADVAANGVTADELASAQKYLTGAYPLRFDGNARIAGILAGMQRNGYGRDYVDTRNDRINAVTLDEINRVAARILQPDDLHFVVVGQPEGLKQE